MSDARGLPTGKEYLDPLDSAKLALSRGSNPIEMAIEVTLPDPNFPTIRLAGPREARILISPDSVELFDRKIASVRLSLPANGSLPFIYIGRFSGQIVLNFKSSRAAFVLENCKNFNLEATFYESSFMYIGRQCSANSCKATIAGASLTFGSDCMLSHGITFQPSDQHDIFDLSSGELINSKRSIVIGDHVWLGKNAYIGSGVSIGSGSIIGATSTVTKDVPRNAIVAGNPARIVREEVTWTRDFTVIPDI